jgi:DNA-binding MarR family transcriptional regulator
MTRMLSRLEEKGVIVREPSEEDRRIVRLRVTPAGRQESQ